MAEGLTKARRRSSRSTSSTASALRSATQILAELSQKPEHKIISLSITSYSEFATSYRALVVIEYL